MDEPEEYFDFDAEWAAQSRPAVPIKVKGRFYTLADELPARAILNAVNMQKRGVKNAKLDELLDTIGMLVGGRANAEQMMDDGIGITQLYDVMNKAMKLVRDGLPAEIREQLPEGQAPAPTGASTSSTAS